MTTADGGRPKKGTTMLARLRGNPWAVLTVVCLGFFMAMLDATIISISIPAVMSGVSATLDQMLWVFNMYILVIAVFYITGGRLSDLFGPRRVFLCGITVFVVASVLCGFSESPGQLIAARALQGVGAAMITPPTISIIVATFPFERLGLAFGIYGSVAGVASIAGPILGGVLVEWLDWRWIFFVNLPVGILCFVAALCFLPALAPARRARFDVPGMLLATGTLLCLSFGLIEGERYDWGHVWSFVSVPLLLGAAVALAGLFLVSQRRADALVPLTLFKDRNYTLMSVMMTAAQCALLGLYLPLAIYLQVVLGLSPLMAGATLIAMAVAASTAGPLAGRFADKMGGRSVLLAGSCLFALGITALTVSIRAGATGWELQAALVLTGLGSGTIWAPMTSVAMRDVPMEVMGAASGVLNTMRQLGNILGGVVVGTVLQTRLGDALVREAEATAPSLPAGIGTRFVEAVEQRSREGFTLGALPSGEGHALPPGLSAETARVLEGAQNEVFERAFATAVQPTLLACVIVLVGAFLCAWYVKEPTDVPGKEPEGLTQDTAKVA